MNPYQTHQNIINHFKIIFINPNRRRAVKVEFRALQIRETDDFHEFLIKFLHIAVEAGVRDKGHRDKLY